MRAAINMAEWSDITLETVLCLLIAVIAYKIYRIKFSAESECCGGNVSVRASNPEEKLAGSVFKKPNLERISNYVIDLEEQNLERKTRPTQESY